jgi:hypothetical protein
VCYKRRKNRASVLRLVMKPEQTGFHDLRTSSSSFVMFAVIRRA